MRASTILIEALRRAATRIETDSTYQWHDATHCNCGILAQELLHCDSGGLVKLMLADNGVCHGSWSRRANNAIRCAKTGLRVHRLMLLLAEHGVEPSDIEAIEFAGISPAEREWVNDFSYGPYVAKYLRTQADLLEEQLTPKPSIPVITMTPAWPTVTLAQPAPGKEVVPTAENPLAPLFAEIAKL